MKGLAVQLTIEGFASLDDQIRQRIKSRKEVETLPPHRAEQAWGGPVPSLVTFQALILNVAVFITDDWTLTIRGKRHMDCVQGLCVFLSVSGDTLGVPIGVEVLDADDGQDDLYASLNREALLSNILRWGLRALSILGIVATVISVILAF